MSRMPLGSLPRTAPGRVGGLVEKLTPGYFALVMASGIISVGLELEGFAVLSWVLLAVCIAAFVVLLALTVWRFVSYRAAVNEDFMDPRRAFGFFTFVAGTTSMKRLPSWSFQLYHIESVLPIQRGVRFVL